MNFNLIYILYKYFFYFSLINIKYKIFYNLILGFYFNNIFIKILFYENIINKKFLGFFLYYIPIYYENKFFFILNKPFNLIIHNLKNYLNNYLINNLLYYYGKKIFYIFRMGLVNRLDRNTSGIVIVSKNFSFYINYINQIFYNLIFKNYAIFLFGKLKSFNIYSYLFFKSYNLKIFNNSKTSISSFFNFKIFNIFNYYFTILKCRIFSGRTHQIRIHLNYIKKYIICDDIYNSFFKYFFLNYISRHSIHLYYLSFFFLNFNIILFNNLYFDMFNFLKILNNKRWRDLNPRFITEFSLSRGVL